MLVKPGDTVSLYIQQKLGDETLFPQATIRDTSGAVSSAVNLSHENSGLYSATATAPDTEGNYIVQIIFYTDSGHTTESGVDEIISYDLEVRHRAVGGMGPAGLDAKGVNDLLEPLAQRLTVIESKVDKKSEFNPNIDKVKTDIQVPSVKDIAMSVNKIVVANKPDYEKRFDRLDKSISTIEIPVPIDYSEDLMLLQQGITQANNREFPIVELSPVIDKINQVVDKFVDNFTSLGESINNLPNKEDLQMVINSFPEDNTDRLLQQFTLLNKYLNTQFELNKPIDNTEVIREYLQAVRDAIIKPLDEVLVKLNDLDGVDADRMEIVRKEVKTLLAGLSQKISEFQEVQSKKSEEISEGVESRFIPPPTLSDSFLNDEVIE